MNCDICNKGQFVRRELGRYDLGPVLGLEGVTLLGAKGLVCDHCGEVMLDGEIAAGTYETPDKVAVAVDRLLEELAGSTS